MPSIEKVVDVHTFLNLFYIRVQSVLILFLAMATFTTSSGELPNVHLSNHPLISHKMTLLRDVNTQPHEFRRILKEVSFFLGYDASRGLTSRTVQIQTPMNVPFEGAKVAESLAIIPVCKLIFI